ncbi:MAG: hypothetical protein ABSG03_19815, partial [Bryobacteraceae bacterium]
SRFRASHAPLVESDLLSAFSDKLPKSSIREVIPFPKTAKGTHLMCDAPSEVQGKNLRELGISLRKK